MASYRYSRYPSDPISTADKPSRALVRAPKESKKNTTNLGSMVKKFIEKRSNPRPGSADRTVLAVPEEIKKKLTPPPAKPSNFTALHRKLFTKGGSADGKTKALTDANANANARTLAMVLRSERELLCRNKEYADEASELKLLVEERNLQVEKLKDLCLKQREEIKALKDAILFPDVMNTQLHDLLEKQGSELKQARQIIPSLQKEVTSLTGKLRCIADDLDEVKAEKYSTRTYFDGHANSPQTPKYDREAPNSLEYSTGGPNSVYGSPDDMFLKDSNPCLTPCFSRTKFKEYDEMSGYDSLDKDISFDRTELSAEGFSGAIGGKVSKSSENRKSSGTGCRVARKICKSDESKWSIGKSKHQSLF